MLDNQYSGTSFDPLDVERLQQAYHIALQSIRLDEQMDSAIAQKLASALIIYATRHRNSNSKEIAQLAIMHLKATSAPPEC